MILAFAVNFLSAIWFANRIWRDQTHFFSKGVGFLTIGIGVWVASSHFLLGLWTLSFSALIFFALRARENWHRLKSWHLWQLEVLDATILEIRMGRSFQHALTQAARQLRDKKVTEFLLGWLSSAQLNLKAQKTEDPFLRELRQIDKQNHQALERLLYLRQRMRMEADFKRRIQQVTLQVRAQAFIVTLIFAGFVIINSIRGAWSQNSVLMFISLFLFVLGLLLIFRLGRKLKWNF